MELLQPLLLIVEEVGNKMIKTNESGFTVVELLTSFALATIVMIFLFNILLAVKKDYMTKKLETDFSIQYALLSDALNSDATNCPLNQIIRNGNTFSISFQSGENCPTDLSELVIEDSQITYKGEVYKFSEGVTIKQDSIEYRKNVTPVSYYYLNIPISIDFNVTGETKEVSLTSFYFLPS